MLADDDFISLPSVVAEGRRSINNIQRSASLFIVKTIYSFILAIVFIFVTVKYPFQPLQLSLISGLTIGLPSFVLALQPNHNIIKGKFMKNVILRAWPASLVTIINIIVLLIFYHNYSYAEYSTVAVMLTSLVGLMMVIRLSIPINPLRGALIAVVATGLALGIFVFGWLFDFVMLSGFSLTLFIVLACVSVVLYNILYTISDKKLIK